MNPSVLFSKRSVIALLSLIAPAAGAELCMSTDAGQTQLSLCGRAPFHSTTAQVTDARLVEVTGSSVSVVVWNETPAGAATVPYYAVSLDAQSVNVVDPTSYDLRLRYARFDPAIETPGVDGALTSDPSNRIYIVQFLTPPLSVFREQLRALGAAIHRPLHNHAHVVEMSATVKGMVEALPYVRAVVPYHPAYRLEPYLVANLANLETLLPQQRYNIMVFERGLAQKTALANQIVTLGGTINRLTPGGFLLEATLTPTQLLAVAQSNNVAFIDRWSEPSTDMDVARQVSGAYYAELTRLPPFLGQGVIGEVLDGYLNVLHQAFRTNPPVVHGAMESLDDGHGTMVFGTVFGDGTGASDEHPELLSPSKGMVPYAQGVFADYRSMTDRYCHTCELVSSDCAVCDSPDPAPPYQAVFQTNSWGNDQTWDYSNVSRELDDIVFTYDILLCQSQGNCGNCPACNCVASCQAPRCSRPEAWSKNVVTVGGVYHLDNTVFADDSWTGTGSGVRASIGPAADERIKPDLTNFFDLVQTTREGSYTPSFLGTSAATPITCGDFGLFFQMWHEGVFPVSQFWGGPVAPSGGQASVFESRPHASTAKAMLINTAMQYDWNVEGTDPHHTLTRDKQGWGMPSAGKLLALACRDAFLLVVNETDVLTEYTGLGYTVHVPPGAAALKITLVYTDPAGNPASDLAMVNHLYVYAYQNEDITSLGPPYYGNYGLRSDIWSPPSVGPWVEPWVPDTVQNIFVKDPVPGSWGIVVSMAGPVYVDARPETPDIDDVDYALVVSVDFDCDAGPGSRLDSEEIADGTKPDCNRNGVPDSCDIATGASSDANGNAIPDECEPPAIVWNDDPLSPDRTTRSLRFRVAALPAAPPEQTAIKVELVSLHHPNPRNAAQFPPPNASRYSTFDTNTNGVCSGATTGPNYNGHPCNNANPDCLGGNPNPAVTTDDGVCSSLVACTAAGESVPPNASGQGGCARWVGRPGTFYEAQDDQTIGQPYRLARLQCTPFYTDWVAETHPPISPVSLIAVVGAEIMPSSEYRVQTYGASCNGCEALCTNVSAPVQMLTRRHGDLYLKYNPGGPPPLTVQPDVVDVSRVVDSFKKLSTGLVKAISKIYPNLPEHNLDVDTNDISAVVEAAKGSAYKYGGPCPCPSAATCGALECPTGADGVCIGSALPGLGPDAKCIKTCTGGPNDGEPCLNGRHCGNTCATGPKAGQWCDDNSGCADNTCTIVGTCGTPLCRDRCGRCTPP